MDKDRTIEKINLDRLIKEQNNIIKKGGLGMINEIYKRIGQRISDSIKEKWVNAVLQIEYIGAVKCFLQYKKPDGTAGNIALVDSFKNMRDIKDLHKIMTEGGKNKWNKAVFYLNADGSFNMEFEWDQKLQDEIERLS